MRRSDPPVPAVHPDSPVQPGRDRPILIFVTAAVGAVALWSLQQSNGLDKPRRSTDSHEAGRDLPAQVTRARPRVAVKARSNLAHYFSTDDYPGSALRREEEGRVLFRLNIDERGRVSDCAITQSSGSKTLDHATCSIIRRRARYSVARDAGGVAVPDTVNGAILWRLPG